MKFNRRQLTKVALMGASAAQAAQNQASSKVTHGPFLGHVTADAVWVWARTEQQGSFRVMYGKAADRLDQAATPVGTAPDHDNAAWTRIGGLQSNTRYYYRIDGGGQPGTFKTLPTADDYRDSTTNPRGLFNFSFAFGSCANQKTSPDLPAYEH